MPASSTQRTAASTCRFARYAKAALATITLAFAGSVASAQSPASEPAAKRSGPPNLVLIVADDQGYNDAGFNGSPDIRTPNLDRLAESGVTFSNGYVSASVCGPSRAGLLTGRYQGRFGFRSNPSVSPFDPTAGLPLTERTIAQVLRPAGYTSMIVGKWHMGSHPRFHPLERGFDRFYGFLSGGHNYFPENLTLESIEDVRQEWQWYRTKLLRDHERVMPNKYLTDEFSDAAVDFIRGRGNEDKPFFLYLAYNAPHGPLQATEETLARNTHIPEGKRRTFAAMITSLDDGVGRLLDELDAQGLAEYTLVVYLSDNGGPVEKGANNDPLRGGKGSLFEGGVRVPFAMRWPGTIPANQTVDAPVISLDILATIASQANLEADPERPLDGVDLIPFLTGKADAPTRTLVWEKAISGPGEAAARGPGEWKFFKPVGGGSPRLYDLSADIGEQTDVWAAQTDAGVELQSAFEAWAEQMVPNAIPTLANDKWWTKAARDVREERGAAENE